MLYVVDRIEGKTAVLVDDGGASLDVPRQQLPKGTREGTVLRVERSASGVLDWSQARVDQVEEDRRLREMEQALGRLRKTDPGGDLTT
jgi:hypothetical protein